MAVATMPEQIEREAFNLGVWVCYREEIRVAEKLCAALLLNHGREAAKRMVRRDAEAAFAPLRYGRRFHPGECLCVDVDREMFDELKAGNEHIAMPGKRGWLAVAKRAWQLGMLPQYENEFDWLGTAQALDELGYAIAESITCLMVFGLDGDASVTAYERRRIRVAKEQGHP